ncbi:MAG: hypothetical protein WCD38_11685 [Candidatus Tumulicola sp.]
MNEMTRSERNDAWSKLTDLAYMAKNTEQAGFTVDPALYASLKVLVNNLGAGA